jgi:Ion channel
MESSETGGMRNVDEPLDLDGLRPRHAVRFLARAPDSYMLLLGLLVVDYVSLNVDWSGHAAVLVRAALFALTVLLAFRTSRVPAVIQRVVQAVVAVAFVVAIGTTFAGGDRADGAQIILISMLVLASPVAIGWRILHHQRVSRETIAGAICIYVLIGLIFANFDYGIQLASGNAFFAQPGQHGLPDFAYFSYITMATVGYGDLTPAPGLPRTMAVLDALVGQVFLVVLLARLVSLYRPIGWRVGLEERLRGDTAESPVTEG